MYRWIVVGPYYKIDPLRRNNFEWSRQLLCKSDHLGEEQTRIISSIQHKPLNVNDSLQGPSNSQHYRVLLEYDEDLP